MLKKCMNQTLESELCVWLFVALVVGALLLIHAPPVALAQGDFDGGAGTENDPYLIATAAHLDNVRNHLDAHFRLIADINMGVAPYIEGEGWQPIGDATTPFTGNFDGDIYVIFNLTINRPTTNYQGLFGYLDGATVEDLYLENVNVQGSTFTGGLAGHANNSTLEQVHLTGEINGGDYTGGLVGYLTGGSNVAYVSSAAVVRGGTSVGGAVGRMTSLGTTIYHAYSLGAVQGTGNQVGGLVGYMYLYGSVVDGYSRAAVSGSSTVGGLVGYQDGSNTQIRRSYSTGVVTATTTTYLGGLVGRNNAGMVADSYWDTETSGQATSAAGTGKTTAQMQQEATFTNWDFTNVWGIVDDTTYPYHLHTPGAIALTPIARTHRNGASGAFTLTVTANVTWTATTTDTWISLTGDTTGMDSGVITYTVDANPVPDLREGTITVVSAGGDITRTFTVHQAAVLALTSQQRTHDAAASGGHAIGVTGNVTWTAQSPDAWITLTAGESGADDGTALYRLDENLSLAPRDGNITITGGGLTRTFTVTQAGAIPYLNLTPEHHHLDWIAATGHEIAVSSNISWTAVTAADWITVTGSSSGTGDGIITYSVAANLAPAPRLGAITLTDGDKTWPFRVHQALSWRVDLFADPEAGGTVSGSGYYTHGQAITVTATPTFGYHFANWAEDGITVSTTSEYAFDVVRNRTLTATFDLNIYTLTYTAGANGTVDSTDVITQYVAHGSDADPVTAVPDVGYYFLEWSDGVTDNPRTDTNLMGDLAVEAEFALGEAPIITSANHTAFEVDVPGTFTVTTTGVPTPTLTYSGTLPGGVIFSDNGDGTATLSGTPATGASGVYVLTFTATNTIPLDASQVFTLTVHEAPAITSADSITFTVGAADVFTVTTTGVPTPTISISGTLPGGITFTDHDDGTATLSGTPAAGTGGVVALTFTATNTIPPDASQPFTLTVLEAPAITSADSVTFTVGAADMFTVIATGVPTPTISLSGTLPNGITLTDHGDGVASLSGTPAAGTGGVYALTFTASNGVASDASQPFTLTVLEAPAITSANSITFTVGAEWTFTVSATGVPTPAIALDGDLPDGVSSTAHGDGTATLSGTPAAGSGGVYALTFTASNGVAPNASQAFTLTVYELSQAGVLFAPDHTVQAQPGEVLTFTHVLTNTGNIIDTFDLTIAGWGVLLTSTPLTLTQSTTATVQVEIAVPVDATGGTVNTTVITATSRLDSAVFATARNVITVESGESCIFLPLVIRNH